jgi:hypothetical protein
MKVTRITVMIAAALLCLGASRATAQTEGGLLNGVERLNLFVMPLDTDSETCGITEMKIRTVIGEAIADTAKPLSLDGRDYVLFVRLSSLPKGKDCFSSVDLGVHWEGRVRLPEYPDGSRAKVKLWENGTIVISLRKDHWLEVASILEHLVRGLASAWHADNGGAG